MVLPVSVNSAAQLHAWPARTNAAVMAAQTTYFNSAGSTTPTSAIGVPTPAQHARAVEATASPAATSLTPRPHPERRQYHPQGAPSAVLSENFFSSRATASPAMMHNMAAIRQVYTSNILRDAPRFTANLNIVA